MARGKGRWQATHHEFALAAKASAALAKRARCPAILTATARSSRMRVRLQSRRSASPRILPSGAVMLAGGAG